MGKQDHLGLRAPNLRAGSLQPSRSCIPAPTGAAAVCLSVCLSAAEPSSFMRPAFPFPPLPARSPACPPRPCGPLLSATSYIGRGHTGILWGRTPRHTVTCPPQVPTTAWETEARGVFASSREFRVGLSPRPGEGGLHNCTHAPLTALLTHFTDEEWRLAGGQ